MRDSDILGKGLLATEKAWPRQLVFMAQLTILASMVFLQLGFVTVGSGIPYLFCLLPLVGPVVTTSLLLGGSAGAAQGLVAGILLVLHTLVLPGSVAEYRFVTPLIVVGLALAGLMAGALFDRRLRVAPTLHLRKRVLALVCLATSAVVTASFVAGALPSTRPMGAWLGSTPLEAFLDSLPLSFVSIPALSSASPLGERLRFLQEIVGSLSVQLAGDAFFTYACVRVAEAMAQIRLQPHDSLSVRLIFRLRLLGVTLLILLVGAASAYVRLTYYCWFHANDTMAKEIASLADQMDHVTLGEGDIRAMMPIVEATVWTYDPDTEGIVTIFDEEGIVATNNAAHASGGAELLATLQALPDTDFIHMTFFDEGGDHRTQQGYYRIARGNGYTIMLVRSDAIVYRDRFFAILSVATTTVILLFLVYVYVAKLLSVVLVDPIDQANASLARITEGNLDEVVESRESAEFASLSDGINTTVKALKDYAAEEARHIESDLATAKRIQQGALPRQVPFASGTAPFDIHASMDAARDVGGDFYDYFRVDRRRLGFLVADVSGKGIPAALFMMEAKNEISSRMHEKPDIAQAMDAANASLCQGNDEGMFVTAWAATLDWEDGTLVYVNAGHNLPLLRHDGIWAYTEDNGGPILGVSDFFSYESHVLQLVAGDELLLYTDGVTEAMNPDNELYGEDRLLAFLQDHTELSPHELDEAVRDEVARWADGAEQSDDVTLLCLEYHPAGQRG